MEFIGRAGTSFSASHHIDGHPRCGRNHGHRWRVEVEILAGQDPKTGDLVGLPELAEAIRQFGDEIDHEDVNDMLVGAPPTGAGVGLFLRERLSMQFTTIRSVTVWMDDVSVSIAS
jgi:6-pyruvoyltetrahydropterin/6-carboxytetrahydropterin synthase